MSSMLTRKSFFGKAVAAAMLPVATRARDKPSTPRLKVGVISDIHLLTANDTTMKGDVYFEKVLRIFDRMRADAVLLCGDIADLGLVAELEYAGAIWDRVFPGGRRSDGEPIMHLFHFGDHDMAGYAHKYGWGPATVKDQDYLKHPLVHEDYAAVWRKVFREEWRPIQVKAVKGYTFVLAHHPHLGEGTAIPGLAEALAAAKPDPTKPFFYSQHRPIYGTVAEYDRGMLARDPNYGALAAYPNVLAFFGHTHRNCVDELGLWQGAFTAVHVPSTNYCTTRAMRENGFTVPGYNSFDWFGDRHILQMRRVDPVDSRQYLFMDVHDDRIVISRNDLMNDGPLGPDWVIPLPCPDGSCAEDVRKAKSVAPAFPAGAVATIVAGWGRDRAKNERPEVVISFPTAPAKGPRPRAFEYEVVATAEGMKPLSRRVFSSRPCWIEAKDASFVTCVFAQNELSGRRPVTFTVRPLNSYGVAGEPLPTVAWRE